MENKFLIIGAIALVLTFSLVDESFAVEQKYIDLMDSYMKNVTDQIMLTEGIAISNYVDYINQTINH